MTLKEPTRTTAFKLIDKTIQRLADEFEEFHSGQIVATTLFPGMYKAIVWTTTISN